MQAELVDRAGSGDREAFGVLAGGAVDRVYAIARLILRDTDLAEDATQEALVRAWRDLPTLRDVERFDGWLYRLTVRACGDVARHRRRWKARQIVFTKHWSTVGTHTIKIVNLATSGRRMIDLDGLVTLR